MSELTFTKRALKKSEIAMAYKECLNILVMGHKGVGKTQRFVNFCEEKKIKYAYYSGSTIDVWLDLIGMPAKTNDGYFEYIPSKEQVSSDIEVFIIDEPNRASEKVMNALFELMLSKSINGKKFPNLRCIWSGINPPNSDDYLVNQLDGAFVDRFDIRLEVPYDVDDDYFKDTHGDKEGAVICNWWRKLTDFQKKNISPRRLDRACKPILNGVPADLLFPVTSTPTTELGAITSSKLKELTESLFSATILEKLLALKDKSKEELIAFLKTNQRALMISEKSDVDVMLTLLQLNQQFDYAIPKEIIAKCKLALTKQGIKYEIIKSEVTAENIRIENSAVLEREEELSEMDRALLSLKSVPSYTALHKLIADNSKSNQSNYRTINDQACKDFFKELKENEALNSLTSKLVDSCLIDVKSGSNQNITVIVKLLNFIAKSLCSLEVKSVRMIDRSHILNIKSAFEDITRRHIVPTKSTSGNQIYFQIMTKIEAALQHISAAESTTNDMTQNIGF